jgi:hypothetical protein
MRDAVGSTNYYADRRQYSITIEALVSEGYFGSGFKTCSEGPFRPRVQATLKGSPYRDDHEGINAIVTVKADDHWKVEAVPLTTQSLCARQWRRGR